MGVPCVSGPSRDIVARVRSGLQAAYLGMRAVQLFGDLFLRQPAFLAKPPQLGAELASADPWETIPSHDGNWPRPPINRRSAVLGPGLGARRPLSQSGEGESVGVALKRPWNADPP